MELSRSESAPQQRLEARLRQLRATPGLEVTQRQLASALHVSPALISSWEVGTNVPPDDRLEAYGRFFGTQRSKDGDTVRLLPPDQLTADERAQVDALVNELVRLGAQARKPDSSQRAAGALGGRFWRFPDLQPITILCPRLSRRQLGYDADGKLPAGAIPITRYSRHTHPNYIASLHNGDIDALFELYGHLRAENPRSKVTWTTYDAPTSDQLNGHVVLLGGADLRGSGLGTTSPEGGVSGQAAAGRLVQRLALPVFTRLPEGGDDEFDHEFVVNLDAGRPTYHGPEEEVHRPQFIPDPADPTGRQLVDDAPQLEYDVGFIARKPNPNNVAASMTLCVGIFSRGTYGAVRAFTDEFSRSPNEHYIDDHFANESDFWMLFRVPIYGGTQTVTPNLQTPSLQLRSSD